jgi:hypothetical protein
MLQDVHRFTLVRAISRLTILSLTLLPMAVPRPNQSLQPTAGRRTAALSFMKTPPLQATLGLAGGG